MRAYIVSLVFLLVSMTQAFAGKRVALVIGNSNYQHTATLPNPKNDAKDVTTALQHLGFEVMDGTDLDYSQFKNLVSRFLRALGTADVGLFFYAGHGLQVAGENYLVPVDAQVKDEVDLPYSMLKLDDILVQMKRSTSTNLIFIDACRDNPLTRNLAQAMGRTRSASIGRGLAPVQTGIGTMITFATQPGNVAEDGDGSNSPFTTALLKHINTPGLDIAPMLNRVRSDVINATKGRQVPWNHSSMTSDFFFQPDTGAQCNLAAQTWTSLQYAKTREPLKHFIGQYPDCPQTQFAKTKLKEISAVVVSSPNQTKEAKPNDILPGNEYYLKGMKPEQNLIAQIIQRTPLMAEPKRLAASFLVLDTGAIITVLESRPDSVWVKARSRDGKTGFIKKSFFKPIAQ